MVTLYRKIFIAVLVVTSTCLPVPLLAMRRGPSIKQPTQLHPHPKKCITRSPYHIIQNKNQNQNKTSVTKNSLSQQQLQQHKTLYDGYIKKWNTVEQELTTINKKDGNISYSPFRSLKIAETFVRNGALLHELYFENIGTYAPVSKITQQSIEKNFGSWQQFKEDLFACLLCARGWVITAYNLDRGTISNYVLDAHNETLPILTVPLLVLDVYEHAYMIDFGINRKDYIETLWNIINWDIVEQRLHKWTQVSQN